MLVTDIETENQFGVISISVPLFFLFCCCLVLFGFYSVLFDKTKYSPVVDPPVQYYRKSGRQD